MSPCPVIPVLGYSNVPEAVDWLCRAFGFAVRVRIADHRAQLKIGEGCLVVATAERDRKLIANLASHRHGLSELDVMCIAWRVLTNQARLVRDKPKMRLVSPSDRPVQLPCSYLEFVDW